MAPSNATVILDFDGTVADSFAMAIGIAQSLLPEYGYPKWSKVEVLEMRELSAAQLIRRVKISPRHLPAIARRVRKEQKARFKTVKPVAGMTVALQELRKAYRVAIISSTEAYLIEEFLAKHQLSDLVEEVIGGAAIFQKHRSIKQYLKRNGLQPNEVIYVGDEVRDVDAARKAKVAVISVAWGFNGLKALTKADPDALVTEPAKLFAAVANLLPR